MQEMKDMPDAEAPRAGMSGTTKLLVGCGLTTLILGVLACGGVIFGVQYGVRAGLAKLNSFAQPFVEKGYERVSGQVVDVRNPVSKNTVYTAQVVRITADVDADLAIMAQVVEISGTVKGDIDFFGQVLTLKPGAVVEGDIRVQAAQKVDVSQGTVKGKITGPIQSLQPPSRGSPDAEIMLPEEPNPAPPTTEPAAESPPPPAD